MIIGVLEAIEIANVAVAMLFVTLFLLKVFKLRHMANARQNLSYLSSTRSYIGILYILLALTLLGVAIAQHAEGFGESFFVITGGGGQCVNAFVIIMQLVVLRSQLMKEVVYTRIHIVYLVYLCLISTIRLAQVFLKPLDFPLRDVEITLSSLALVNSTIMLAYWIKRRADLPDFQPKQFVFDNFKQTKNDFLSANNQTAEIYGRYQAQKGFPYLRSTVLLEGERFRIILDDLVPNSVLRGLDDSTVASNARQDPPDSYHFETISEQLYSLEEAKRLYLECMRLPIPFKMTFVGRSLQLIAQDLGILLCEVLREKAHYRPVICHALRLDTQRTGNYEKILSERTTMSTIQEVDGLSPNTAYMSVKVHKVVLIDDHFEYYLKVSFTTQNVSSEPFARFSEFDQFNSRLNRLAESVNMKIPSFPSKKEFLKGQEKIKKRQEALQLYFRRLCNDSALLEVPMILDCISSFLKLSPKGPIKPNLSLSQIFRKLTVQKGALRKNLAQNQIVTYFDFALKKDNIVLKLISKRFSDFVILHQEVQRRGRNQGRESAVPSLPERILITKESARHDKLKTYLEALLEDPDLMDCYELYSFLNEPVHNKPIDPAISFIENANSQSHYMTRDFSLEMSQSNGNVLFSDSTRNVRLSNVIDELG